MKAFVIDVVGDIGLVIAECFVVRELGTFDSWRRSTPRRSDLQARTRASS